MIRDVMEDYYVAVYKDGCFFGYIEPTRCESKTVIEVYGTRITFCDCRSESDSDGDTFEEAVGQAVQSILSNGTARRNEPKFK